MYTHHGLYPQYQMYDPRNPYFNGMPQARVTAQQNIPPPKGNENNGATDEFSAQGFGRRLARNVVTEGANTIVQGALSAFLGGSFMDGSEVKTGTLQGSEITGGAAGNVDGLGHDGPQVPAQAAPAVAAAAEVAFPGGTKGYNFAVNVSNLIWKERGQPYFLHPGKGGPLYAALAQIVTQWLADHNNNLPDLDEQKDLPPAMRLAFAPIKRMNQQQQ